VRHHHVLGLATHPTAHIDIAVRSTRTRGIDVQANACRPLFTIPAASTGDVEGHGDQIAYSNEFHIASGFDDLTCNLMSQNQSFGRRRSAPHHVLIASADVGRNDLEDYSVLALPVSKGQFGEVDTLHFYQSHAHVGHAPITCHRPFLLFASCGLHRQLPVTNFRLKLTRLYWLRVA